MDVVGIDVGFGYTTTFNRKNSVFFKPVLGNPTKIQFKSFLGPDRSDSNLHITLDQDRLISDFIKALAITAIGVCCKNSISLNVVSGLPVGFLTRDYKRFADLLMDDSGKINNQDLSQEKIGVVDIGFKTTDFSIFDRLQYIEQTSTILDTGISKCFSVIASKLCQESGVDIELYRMFDFMESGTIKIRGKDYNLSNLKTKVYTHAAKAIATDLNRLWESDWDIGSIIFSGGGSMELAPFIQPQVQGSVTPIASGVDAHLNNVQGYLKFGKYKWRDTQDTSSGPNGAVEKETGPINGHNTHGQENNDQKSNGAKGLGWLKGSRT